MVGVVADVSDATMMAVGDETIADAGADASANEDRTAINRKRERVFLAR